MKHIATWIERDRSKYFDELFVGTDFRLWNGRIEEVPWDDVRGLLLTGGSDISTEYLRQEGKDGSLIRNPDLTRDRWEFPTLRLALDQGLPILAICRGHQVLNVALGGTLHLDIPNHNLPEQKYGNIQELQYTPLAQVRFPKVNSSHHQAIDKLGDGLEIEAWHPGDDVIEQVNLRNYPFCLGVQYHPERDIMYRSLFNTFFEHIS